jgi:hypothetical protein
MELKIGIEKKDMKNGVQKRGSKKGVQNFNVHSLYIPCTKFVHEL